MSRELVMVGWGKETFDFTSLSLSAFDVRDGFIRTLLSKKHKRHGAIQRFPSSDHSEITGYLYLESVECEEGTIILVQASCRVNGRGHYDGGIFLRVRKGAPLVVIKANLPAAPDALQTGTFLAFQGRADILGEEELASYGIAPHGGYISAYMDQEDIDMAFVVEELAGGTAKPRMETVETTDGDVVQVAAKPARRVRFR